MVDCHRPPHRWTAELLADGILRPTVGQRLVGLAVHERGGHRGVTVHSRRVVQSSVTRWRQRLAEAPEHHHSPPPSGDDPGHHAGHHLDFQPVQRDLLHLEGWTFRTHRDPGHPGVQTGDRTTLVRRGGGLWLCGLLCAADHHSDSEPRDSCDGGLLYPRSRRRYCSRSASRPFFFWWSAGRSCSRPCG